MEILKTLLPFSVVPLHFGNIPSFENLLSASTFPVFQNEENYLIVGSNEDSMVFKLYIYFNLNRSSLLEFELTTENNWDIDHVSYSKPKKKKE